MNVSVVIIGRNEGLKLTRCLKSLAHCREVVQEPHIKELIYVDSDSSDNSISEAVSRDVDHVVKISGEINAAVARNVGAKYVTSEWILFVDGDMEIHPEFFQEEVTQEFFRTETFFSGQFINVFYDDNWNETSREDFVPADDIMLEPAPGGLFIIKTDVWRELGGMKEHYIRSEDHEFGLRCSKAGHTFKRINRLLATHHMISYYNIKRNFDFFRNSGFVVRSMLYRDHILKSFNRNGLRIFWNQDKSFLVLVLALIGSLVFGPKVLLIYLFAIMIRAFKKRREGFFFMTTYFILRDIQVLYGFFFFFPKTKLNYEVEEIKSQSQVIYE